MFSKSIVTWLEKQVLEQVKVIVVTYFARKSNDLVLYSCDHGIGKLNKQLLRCSFPGDLPKMNCTYSDLASPVLL